MFKSENIKTPEMLSAEQLASKAQSVRSDRDSKMKDVVNWYQRYEREVRQQLPLTLTLEQIDNYAQALAEVPDQAGFPLDIVWPTIS